MKFDFTQQIKQKTNEELTEIFINAKDYNPEFVRLAEEELTARNINIDTSRQTREKNKEINKEQLQAGKNGSSFYIFLCFVLALFGGFLAIYAGYIYSQSKIKAAEGNEYYVYNEPTRQLGKIMMWLGIGVLLFLVLKYCF
jgi:hypothetical protein